MAYTVKASTQTGDSFWPFDKAIDAVKKAADLLGNGVQDLTIETPSGRFYRDDELDQLLAVAELTERGRT